MKACRITVALPLLLRIGLGPYSSCGPRTLVRLKSPWPSCPAVHALSGFQRLLLLVGEVVGLVGLFTDKLVSLASYATLQPGPIVKPPIKQPGTHGRARSDTADYSAL